MGCRANEPRETFFRCVQALRQIQFAVGIAFRSGTYRGDFGENAIGLDSVRELVRALRRRRNNPHKRAEAPVEQRSERRQGPHPGHEAEREEPGLSPNRLHRKRFQAGRPLAQRSNKPPPPAKTDPRSTEIAARHLTHQSCKVTPPASVVNPTQEPKKMGWLFASPFTQS